MIPTVIYLQDVLSVSLCALLMIIMNSCINIPTRLGKELSVGLKNTNVNVNSKISDFFTKWDKLA